MKLTLEEVEHIAALARLSLTDEEKETYRLQLSAVLDYAASLQELDTRDISPTASVLSEQCPTREDELQDSLGQAEILKNAKSVRKDQFQVPPVMEG